MRSAINNILGNDTSVFIFLLLQCLAFFLRTNKLLVVITLVIYNLIFSIKLFNSYSDYVKLSFSQTFFAN